MSTITPQFTEEETRMGREVTRSKMVQLDWSTGLSDSKALLFPVPQSHLREETLREYFSANQNPGYPMESF